MYNSLVDVTVAPRYSVYRGLSEDSLPNHITYTIQSGLTRSAHRSLQLEPQTINMTIVHIVLFEFRPETDPDTVKDVRGKHNNLE